MCGICGEFRNDFQPGVKRELLEEMTSLLAHRGPDDSGCYIEDPAFAGLGQRRLSIIDIPGGVQPMPNEDQSIWLSFNGEIYNFRELRDELKKRGHVFRTRSDTEVIIHQYEEDGIDCVKRFNGMFAFALWDSRQKRMFLCRDRMGIKPLYYYFQGRRLVFSSEVRSLLAGLSEIPPLDMSSLWAYLVIRYVPAPYTLFTGIYKLPPAHRLVADQQGVKTDCYWELPEDPETVRGKEAEEGLMELLQDSVKKRLIADVPLGAFLSGGIDSTALVSIMRDYKGEGLETFSVDFHAEKGADYLNETPWSELAAGTFQTNHHPLTVTARDAVDALPAVVDRMDDLVSDPAIIPTYLVSRFARQWVTVVLSGEGGDELFAGYQRYSLGYLTRYYQHVPKILRRVLFELPASRLPHMRRIKKGLTALSGASPAARHLAWLITLQPDVSDRLIGSGTRGRDLVEGIFEPDFRGQKKAYDLDRTLRADLKSWLPDDLLTKVDRASMAVGLETRVPFLDHRLVEFAMRIPAREKADFFHTKKVMKRAVAGRVPPEIVKRKKAGFALPLDEWFRGELREMVGDLLNPDRLREQGIFDADTVEAMLGDHLSCRENQGHALFSLLIFQLWRDSIYR
ncbi:MAG: asparagine synthase (glutamine-hydrolyzing) [bacterium]